MDARLQLRVQRYGWDRAAALYDRTWRRQLAPAQDLLLEMADLQPGEEVVEVACGSGIVTLRAAGAVGPRGRVVGTDLSEGMLEEARRAAEGAGAGNVDLQRLGAEALGMPDGGFDAALCSLGLMYVSDPLAALREMGRVLRAGGRAVVAVWGERSRCGWADIFPIVDARVETEVCPLFFQLGTGETLRLHMEAAGFQEVEARRIATTLEYSSPEEALAAAFEGGAVALAYSRFDEDTRAEAHREYLASIAPYMTDGGYRIPGEFVVARARWPGAGGE
jgi:ubiquinone/menaquinone biosynthesis C-methylase UbiE